jgi:hypothetical protein
MSSTLLCNGCGGRKQVSPLGGILKKCAICEGIGYISIPETIIEDPQSVVDELKNQIDLNRVLKRGRPKR